MRLDPRNRAMPLVDVILLPDADECALIVMPLLREFDTPPFARRTEVIEALRQFLQGNIRVSNSCTRIVLRIGLSSKSVVSTDRKLTREHRDACWANLMMDHTKVSPKGFHPQAPWSTDGLTVNLKWKPRYSVAPVDYYIIDFGLTTWFRFPEETSMSTGIFSQDKTVPELSETVPYDAYKVDIHQFGRVINMLIENYAGYLDMFVIGEDNTMNEIENRRNYDR